MSYIEILLQLLETSESELSKLRPLLAPLALPDKVMLLGYQSVTPARVLMLSLHAYSRLLPSASGLLHRPFSQSIMLSVTLKNKFSFGLPEPFQSPQGPPHTHTRIHTRISLSFPSATSSTMASSGLDVALVCPHGIVCQKLSS